ncbi:hypothetical protein ACWGXJ_26430 [Paenibacillus sp. S33]
MQNKLEIRYDDNTIVKGAKKMSAHIFPFPRSAKQPAKEIDPFEEALAEMEERLGVSVSDYLGFSGNPEETKKNHRTKHEP